MKQEIETQAELKDYFNTKLAETKQSIEDNETNLKKDFDNASNKTKSEIKIIEDINDKQYAQLTTNEKSIQNNLLIIQSEELMATHFIDLKNLYKKMNKEIEDINSSIKVNVGVNKVLLENVEDFEKRQILILKEVSEIKEILMSNQIIKKDNLFIKFFKLIGVINEK